jgi:uncharacterized LabA/DUF88 family protein
MHPQSTSDVHRELQRHGNIKPSGRRREFRPPINSQRVAIAIDVQNLYYGAKDFSWHKEADAAGISADVASRMLRRVRGDGQIDPDKFASEFGIKREQAYKIMGSRFAKVAMERVIERALNGRQLVRAIAYIADKEGNNQSKFIGIMKRFGCDIRQKRVAEYDNGHFKCNWDVEIAVDAMAIAPKIDVFILVSGDGDFSYLLQAMKLSGVRTEVMSFRINTSGALVAEADRYFGMRQDMLLLERKQRSDGNGGMPREKRRDDIGNRRPEPEPEPESPTDDYYEPPDYPDE